MDPNAQDDIVIYRDTKKLRIKGNTEDFDVCCVSADVKPGRFYWNSMEADVNSDGTYGLWKVRGSLVRMTGDVASDEVANERLHDVRDVGSITIFAEKDGKLDPAFRWAVKVSQRKYEVFWWLRAIAGGPMSVPQDRQTKHVHWSTPGGGSLHISVF